MTDSVQQREQNLWRAVAVVGEAWKETNAMLDELSALIIDALPKSLGVNVKQDEDGWERIAGECVSSARVLYWALTPRGKGRRNPCGWLYAAAAIGPNGRAEMRFGEKPTLTLGYYGSEVEPRSDLLRIDDPSFDLGKVALAGADRLLVTVGTGLRFDDASADWCFSVPLFALSSRDRLAALLVDPTVGLLAGKTPESIFRPDSEALQLRLSEVGDLQCA